MNPEEALLQLRNLHIPQKVFLESLGIQVLLHLIIRIFLIRHLITNIIGVPTLVDVYEGTTNSQLLRRRRALNINPNNGDVGTYAVFDGTNNITTDILYNAAGNVTKVTYPPNESLQRYTTDYTYDDAVTGKYVLEVKDVFNIKSSATYRIRFSML